MVPHQHAPVLWNGLFVLVFNAFVRLEEGGLVAECVLLWVCLTLLQNCTSWVEDPLPPKDRYAFSATIDRNEFLSFRWNLGKTYNIVLGSGQVVLGMDMGLREMCVGEKRTVIIPPHLGYGEAGVGECSCSRVRESHHLNLGHMESHSRLLPFWNWRVCGFLGKLKFGAFLFEDPVNFIERPILLSLTALRKSKKAHHWAAHSFGQALQEGFRVVWSLAACFFGTVSWAR